MPLERVKMSTEIALYDTIEAIVADYERQKEIVGQARKAVEKMNDQTSITIHFNTGYHYNSTTPEAELKRNFWQRIIEKSHCERFMSNKAQEELRKTLWNDPDELPDITYDGLNNWLLDLMRSSPDRIAEACREVFELLTPQQGFHDNYKTNEKAREIPASGKVILTWQCDADKWVTTPRLSTRGKQTLRTLDRVFSLLDGKQTPVYPFDSITACNEATQREETYSITEYFEFRMCKNGNLHVDLLRPDLVQKLVETASGRNISGKSAA